MRTIKLFMTILFSVFFLSKFNSQNIDKLKSNNGFRTIKLGSDIRNYKNLKLVFNKGDIKRYSLDLYKSPNFQKIGHIPIKELVLKTFQNNIYSIDITTSGDFSLIGMLTDTFGEASHKSDLGWFWRTDNIELSVMGANGILKDYYLTFECIEIRNNAWKYEREKELQNNISEF